jgi:hypothetical protein
MRFTPDETLNWHISSRSGHQSNCVEVAFSRGSVFIRDSKDQQGPVLTVSQAQWTAFLCDIVHET